MMDKISRKHILPITGLLLFSALIISGAMGQVTTQNSGEYDLNVTTDSVSNVKETEATFQATVDQLDSNFDAALVYWNYSADSSLDQKGPADIAFSAGEQASTLASGLNPDTAYNVEAYAEPVVWNDETLGSNVAKKMDRQGLVGNFLGYVGGSISGSNVNSLFANMNQEGFENWVAGVEDNPGEVPSNMAVDLSSLDTGSPYSEFYDAEAAGVILSPDGKNMVVADDDNTPNIKSYNLTEPWNVSSAMEYDGFDAFSLGWGDIEANPSGDKIFVSSSGGEIRAYNLDSPWDLSSASQYDSVTVDYGHGMDFSPDGSKMFVSDRGDYGDGAEVTQFNLSSSWSLSSATNVTTFSTEGEESESVAFSYDGSKMFVGGQNNGVREYDVSQPWNLNSELTYVEEVFSGSSTGLDVSPSGDRLFVSYFHGGVRGYQ